MPHTPGPWTLDTDRTILCPPEQAAPGGGRGIAEIRSWMGQETADANASLIAAAPELLAALKETREVAAALFRVLVARHMVDDVLAQLPAGFVNKTEGFGVRADRAIAKAEGR